MTLLQAIILGVLQGFTEFLPVSSSGHLVLMESFMDLTASPEDMLTLNVLLHAGTLLALLIIYTRQWWTLLTAPMRADRSGSLLLWRLIIATIPAGIIGILYEDVIATVFQSRAAVGIAFLVTALVLVLGERAAVKEHLWSRVFRRNSSHHAPSVTAAILIGLAQAAALVPGLSRSGLTVSAARAAGLDRRSALDFSFLMAMPVIAGATLLACIDMVRGTAVLPDAGVVVAAVFSSFMCSLLAIVFLRRLVASRSLAIFMPYLVVIGIVTLLMGAA